MRRLRRCQHACAAAFLIVSLAASVDACHAAQDPVQDPVRDPARDPAPSPAQGPLQDPAPHSALNPPASAQPDTKPPAPETNPPSKLKSHPCISPAEAATAPKTDTCVTAHVFNVVELSDGTRFLDICPETVPDEQCRFTIVSPPSDRDEVGDLNKYRDKDVRVRGMVLSVHGRMGIVLSHVRQFSGGPEKFRPNPRLLHNFNGQSDRMPVHDPNLRASGHHRSFMNTRDVESLAGPRK